MTIKFMTALYQGGFSDMIDLTFENIRRGSHQQQEAPPAG
jgi:hypothetical protein